MEEEIIASGKIFELVQMPQPDGRVFEKARRAPGVRLIIADKTQQKVLMTKEFRHELQAWDYRLPGGKVFDSLEEFSAHRTSGDDIEEAARLKAIGEGREEAGVEVQSVELFQKSTLGATVEWDLYVFEVKEWQFHKDGQDLKEDEVDDIAGYELYSYSDTKRMIMDGDMQEDRVALILLRWLESQ